MCAPKIAHSGETNPYLLQDRIDADPASMMIMEALR
jgi:hypothetical protein